LSLLKQSSDTRRAIGCNASNDRQTTRYPYCRPHVAFAGRTRLLTPLRDVRPASHRPSSLAIPPLRVGLQVDSGERRISVPTASPRSRTTPRHLARAIEKCVSNSIGVVPESAAI
jgi:hypothetical protein